MYRMIKNIRNKINGNDSGILDVISEWETLDTSDGENIRYYTVIVKQNQSTLYDIIGSVPRLQLPNIVKFANDYDSIAKELSVNLGIDEFYTPSNEDNSQDSND